MDGTNMKTMTSFYASILVGLVCLTAIAYSQTTDFQTGKIIAVEKVGTTGGTNSAGGTDAAAQPETDRYSVSVQLADMVYVCRVKMPGGSDLDWAKGKEVPAKTKGNAMYLKRSTGKV